MAHAQGLSEATVRHIWQCHQLKPHVTKRFKLSRNKAFVETLVDNVGLSLNPPDRARVLSVDEKSQKPALDWTQPDLPLKTAPGGTMTHDDKRNGTTTLFAARSMLNGNVIGDCMPRHRHQKFIRCLKTIETETPPDLGLLAQSRGALVSRPHRQAHPTRFVRPRARSSRDHRALHLQSNQNPSVFDWTASVENILAKIAKWKEALGARH